MQTQNTNNSLIYQFYNISDSQHDEIVSTVQIYIKKILVNL